MAKKKSLAAGRQAVALFLAFTLILTVASVPPGGPVGQVSASHAECSETDELFWVMSLGYLNNPFAVNQQCDPSALSDHADDLEDAHENATEVELYNTAAQIEADSEQYRAVVENSVMDSGTPAMAKAEAAAIAEIDAGGTEAEVEQAAEDAVQDYYSRKQMNLIDQWNVEVLTLETMYVTLNASSVDNSFISHNETGSATPYEFTQVDGTTSPLVNGTEQFSYGVEYESVDDPTGGTLTGTVHSGHGSFSTGERVYGVEVDAIEGESAREFIYFDDYASTWQVIEDKSDQVEANAVLYADRVYNATQNGSADASDFVSGATLAQEYATDYNSTGFYSYLVGFSATQGMAIPNLSTTSLMTIQTTTDIHQGLLMSQNAPDSGVWEVGATYNALDIEGKQFVATTDGEVVELDGEFSITSMEGPDGESVDTTTSQEFNYTVTNESGNYSELQEELQLLRTEIEDIEPAPGSGGGSGGFDFNIGTTGLAVVAAGVAVLLLFGRN